MLPPAPAPEVTPLPEASVADAGVVQADIPLEVSAPQHPADIPVNMAVPDAGVIAPDAGTVEMPVSGLDSIIDAIGVIDSNTGQDKIDQLSVIFIENISTINDESAGKMMALWDARAEGLVEKNHITKILAEGFHKLIHPALLSNDIFHKALSKSMWVN